jgi:hypothetical protein
MAKLLLKKSLRVAAFLPALFLGVWLINYTQKQSAPKADTADPFQIDLNLAPEVIEFDSFINYGTPIESKHVIMITSKRIEMPVFDTTKTTDVVTPRVLSPPEETDSPFKQFLARLSREFFKNPGTP